MSDGTAHYMRVVIDFAVVQKVPEQEELFSYTKNDGFQSTPVTMNGVLSTEQSSKNMHLLFICERIFLINQ